MIKLIFNVKRRDDVSADHFYDYWLHQHGSLVKSFRESLRISRYVQSHTCFDDLAQLARESRGMTHAYDGLAELWWEDVETLRAALASEEGQKAGAALIEDEARFIDLAKSTISFSEEHVIFDRQP